MAATRKWSHIGNQPGAHSRFVRFAGSGDRSRESGPVTGRRRVPSGLWPRHRFVGEMIVSRELLPAAATNVRSGTDSSASRPAIADSVAAHSASIAGSKGGASSARLTIRRRSSSPRSKPDQPTHPQSSRSGSPRSASLRSTQPNHRCSADRIARALARCRRTEAEIQQSEVRESLGDSRFHRVEHPAHPRADAGRSAARHVQI